MKYLSYLIIIICLFSCQSKVDKHINLESYSQGIETLRQVDTVGNTDYPKALSLFEESVKTNPNHIESRYWKALCEIHMNKLEEALQTSELTIKKFEMEEHSLMPSFLIYAGIIERINENMDSANVYFIQAKYEYEKRFKKDENDFAALMNISFVLSCMDKNEEALEFISSVKITNDNKELLEQIKADIEDYDIDKALKMLTNIY